MRGEQRAKATREAYARGDTPPPPRRPVHTREWREKKDRRLIAEGTALAAAQVEHQHNAAEENAALEAERARLAEQAAEQDAVLAGAEALGAGLIDPAQVEVTLGAGNPDDEGAAQIITRINKSPSGWRRAVAALTPGWQRMRQAATQEAEAKLADEKARVVSDRTEIEDVWQTLADMTRRLLPKDVWALPAREQVARVMARWRSTKDREPARRNPAQRDD